MFMFDLSGLEELCKGPSYHLCHLLTVLIPQNLKVLCITRQLINFGEKYLAFPVPVLYKIPN